MTLTAVEIKPPRLRGIRRHRDVIQLILSGVSIVSGSLYFATVSADDGLKPLLKGGHITSLLAKQNQSQDITLVVFLVSLGLQIFVGVLGIKTSRHAASLEPMLKSAALALVYPDSISDKPLRAFCHRLERGHLIPVCSDGFQIYSDISSRIPIDEQHREYVVVQAVLEQRIVAQELPPQRSADERLRNIWKDIANVLAAPIHDPHSREIIGAISFDSSMTEAQFPLNTLRAQQIAGWAAQSIGFLWTEQ
jgi:hypothetical protein